MKAITLYSIGTRFAPILLTLGVVGYYFWFLERFAVNLPFYDDYGDVLQFILGVVKAADLPTALHYFFDPYVNHRTTASRLVFYAAYLVEGEINFRSLTLVGNLALPMILGLLYIRVRPQQYCWLILLPVALLLFQLRAYDIVNWAQPAFAFQFVWLYGFCCIYALHRVTIGKFVLAIVFATLACLTLASGQIVWLIGLASLLQQRFLQKSAAFSYAILWSLIAVAVLTLWHTQTGPAVIMAVDSSALFGHTPTIIELIVQYLQFFLVLLGGIAGDCRVFLGGTASDSNVVAATITGTVLIGALAVFSASSYSSRDIRLELCGWYIALSAAAVAFGRANFTPVEYALTSRYALSSVLMCCMLWVLVAMRIKKHQPLVLFLGVLVAGTFSMSSYRQYSVRVQQTTNQKIDAFNQYMSFSLLEGSRDILREAVSLGVYKPPPRPFPMRTASGEEESATPR